MAAEDCKKCGAPGSTKKCSRCKSVSYCSKQCQRADWTRHKRSECEKVELLPPGFVPQSHIFCIHCGKHFMVCGCTGLAHGEDMMYVMDEIPVHFTVMQRIQRWALLIEYHPLLSRFNAKQFVLDLPKSFTEDLKVVKPVIQNLMDQYKETALHDTCSKLGITTKEGYEQCCKDCDYVMEHFFKGNWGYPTVLEFTFLNNAVQMSGPEDFDPEMGQRVRNVFVAFRTILQTFTSLGVKNLNFRMEDIKNMQPE